MSKELLFKTFRCGQTDRPAWIPFAGVHAGKLVGYNAIDVLTNEEKLLEALRAVNEIYDPDGQIVVFDLQVEAEILGCRVKYVEDSTPIVISNPLKNTMDIPCECKIPGKSDGRLPLILSAMKIMKKEVGEKTALIGLVCGPFTLASHLRGVDIFMDMYDDPEYVRNLLNFCSKVSTKIADYYIEAGMDIIGIVDPLISQISPDDFSRFMSNPFSKCFNHINNQVLSAFFVCGDATKNIDLMCQTKPNAIFIDENVNIALAKRITDKYQIAIGGNIQLTVTMLHGTQNDNRRAVIDIIDECDDRNGLVIAPGCDMPYNVPIENTIAAMHAVKNYYQAKLIIEQSTENMNQTKEQFKIALPNYHALSRPFVEVFTLDSRTCAACSYMYNTIVETHLNNPIFDYIEYRYTEKENIIRCQMMKVTNLPSIYINGELIFSSIIPSKKELLDEIIKRVGQNENNDS